MTVFDVDVLVVFLHYDTGNAMIACHPDVAMQVLGNGLDKVVAQSVFGGQVVDCMALLMPGVESCCSTYPQPAVRGRVEDPDELFLQKGIAVIVLQGGNLAILCVDGKQPPT